MPDAPHITSDAGDRQQDTMRGKFNIERQSVILERSLSQLFGPREIQVSLCLHRQQAVHPTLQGWIGTGR